MDRSAATTAKQDASDRSDGLFVSAEPLRFPTRYWMPYLTGAACFVLGALFWHLVGFWSFVSQVAFNDDQQKSAARLINLDTVQAVRRTEHVALAPRPAARQPNVTIAVINADANTGDMLAELLQCSQVRPLPDATGVDVQACPPLRTRLPHGNNGARANRLMDAREAAERLANGWVTGVSSIETGSLPKDR